MKCCNLFIDAGFSKIERVGSSDRSRTSTKAPLGGRDLSFNPGLPSNRITTGNRGKLTMQPSSAITSTSHPKPFLFREKWRRSTGLSVLRSTISSANDLSFARNHRETAAITPRWRANAQANLGVSINSASLPLSSPLQASWSLSAIKHRLSRKSLSYLELRTNTRH